MEFEIIQMQKKSCDAFKRFGDAEHSIDVWRYFIPEFFAVYDFIKTQNT